MNTSFSAQLLVTTICVFSPLLSKAEVLRCENGSVSEGDRIADLTRVCGRPERISRFCQPLQVQNPNFGDRQQLTIPLYGPCIDTQEWFYPRGAGDLPATVVLRFGSIVKILYGNEK